MAAGGEPSPSPPPPPPSPAKHSRSPDDAQPDASPKRRKRYHHRRHHHHRRHRHTDSPVAVAADDEVEEGEILDDAAAAAMDVDADSAAPQAPLVPERLNNGADTDSNADATKLQASALPTLPSSKDGRKSLNNSPESESGGILSSDAEDTKGYEQSQSLSKSPKSRKEKERRRRDERHSSSSKDYHSKNHSRTSHPRHHSEAYPRDHSRSREKSDGTNGSRASLRDGSDHDSNDRNGKSGRHTTSRQENERERSSIHLVHDRPGGRHRSRERYRDVRIDRDKVDSLEATRRLRERSRSRSRSDLKESARVRDQSRERERQSGSSRHKDHERKRDTSKDWNRKSDRVDSVGERERVRDDRDREWHRVKESETRRAREGRDNVSDIERHGDSTRSRYSTSEGYRERARSREKDRNVDHKSRRSEEMKENSFNKEEDEEEYQEKIEQQLAMQEEDDPEKLKEEARRRKEAIMAKYRQQQFQKQHMESKLSSNNEEVRAIDGDETTHLKDDNDSSSTGNYEAENKHDSSEVFAGKADFTVGKSPAHNDTFVSTGAFSDERMIGVSGLGEGSPKSERSADMFCDDIFGESPAGIRKLGKDDGLHIERNALHDNWDDADGYYTYRFGESLDGRYEITAAHGKGVFSTVVRAKDLKAGKDDPEEVAIKIIRNNDTMYKAGKQEVSILEKLASVDREDKRHCVRFISSFMYRNHLCLVFESLNMNLREVLKKFGRNIGLKLTAVRAYSKQLFIALKHLKNCKVLHCDIKPDNMLVNEAKNVLKLCDFGNAMLAGMNEVTPYLVSRFYRAPEIILGLPYDHPLDMWSVGCCLYELYTGKVLFPGPSNNAMLRLHMELKGPFPKKMLRKGAFTMQHFDQDLNFHATEEDPVTKMAVRRLILNIKPKDIGSLISNFPGEDPKMLSSFKDLLDKIFILDPEKRITVSQALSHPFITGK
ncbi:serine/threonine-protein kinase prpf4B-like [Panicum miliaceum]|uniref:non-specific serine/threonine protein kinase n=1 Tax=Panicum miliaceum TaxID=4540 RepID=A0A3L6T2Z0_PANMI|nr:serine/threonine-protein kinase prpf4B-like [Panicum miliaceum]